MHGVVMFGCRWTRRGHKRAPRIQSGVSSREWLAVCASTAPVVLGLVSPIACFMFPPKGRFAFSPSIWWFEAVTRTLAGMWSAALRETRSTNTNAHSDTVALGESLGRRSLVSPPKGMTLLGTVGTCTPTPLRACSWGASCGNQKKARSECFRNLGKPLCDRMGQGVSPEMGGVLSASFRLPQNKAPSKRTPQNRSFAPRASARQRAGAKPGAESGVHGVSEAGTPGMGSSGLGFRHPKKGTPQRTPCVCEFFFWGEPFEKWLLDMNIRRILMSTKGFRMKVHTHASFITSPWFPFGKQRIGPTLP